MNEEFFLLITILSINETKLDDPIKSRKVHSHLEQSSLFLY